MRRVLLAVVTLGLVVAWVAPVHAQDEAKDVVKKAIEASGGTEKIDKFKGVRTSGKGTISIQGLEAEYTSEGILMYPDKSKETLKLDIMGQAITIEQKQIGDKTTMTINGMAMDLPDALKEEMKLSTVLESVQRLTPLLRDAEFKLKSLGASKIDGKDVSGIEVGGKGLKDVKIYFEKSTGLLIQIERRGLDPTGMKELKQVMRITEYKEVNGLKKPSKVTVTNDGQKFLESTTTKIEVLEKIDDKEFSD